MKDKTYTSIVNGEIVIVSAAEKERSLNAMLNLWIVDEFYNYYINNKLPKPREKKPESGFLKTFSFGKPSKQYEKAELEMPEDFLHDLEFNHLNKLCEEKELVSIEYTPIIIIRDIARRQHIILEYLMYHLPEIYDTSNYRWVSTVMWEFYATDFDKDMLERRSKKLVTKWKTFISKITSFVDALPESMIKLYKASEK